MKKKPIKTLKSKILMPFFIVIMILSLLVLLAFNVSMRVYMNRVALNEIGESRETVKTLLRNEMKNLNQSGSGTRAQDLIVAINRSFRLSVTTTGTEMALLGAGGKLILPRTADLSIEMQEAVNQVGAKLKKGESTGTYNMKFGNVNYLVSFSNYNESLLNARAQTLVMIASKEASAALIRRTNFILILILSMSVLIGFIVSNRLANDITRPIKSVSDYAQKLKNGHYEKMALSADTFEIHSLYNNLNNMSETLKHREKTKIDFIQNFSHDLRTPLMSIQGYAEGIKAGVFDDPAKAAGVIADESQRLTHLLDQLITLSRLDLPDHRLEWTHLNLSQFLSILIERHEGYATKEQKRIFLDCPKEATLFTSEDLLEKTVANILGNAIRYASTQVKMTVNIRESTTTITITDDGPGIPEHILPDLFRRFVKGSEGQFGLGLSIAYTAAEQLGANLKAENTEKGTTFTLKMSQKA